MPRPGEPYYVTTPIYYVNGEPHLGHAYTTIAADVAAAARAPLRAPTPSSSPAPTSTAPRSPQAAAAAGLTPQASTPIRSPSDFRDLARRSKRTNDFFIRTTDPEHEAFVQRFVERMRERGDLYEGTYAGLYCTACEAFYTRGRPDRRPLPRARHRSGVHGGAQHVLPPLGLRRPPARALCRGSAPSCCPQTRLNEARSFVEGGLEDVSISRDAVRLGRAAAVGRRSRRSTSGSTRCSTTPRRSRTRARRGSDRAPAGRRAGSCWARTSCASTP